MTDDVQPPRPPRRRKRDYSWSFFCQALLFAVTAAVLKSHFGIDLAWHP